LRKMAVHGRHHLVDGMRPGHGEHFRVRLPHHVTLGAQAPGDNDPAVFSQRLANGIQGFFNRAVDESAGVDDHEFGVAVIAGSEIALGTQLREDSLRINQGLGAAQ